MRKNPITQLVCFERESALRRKHGGGVETITPMQRTWTRYMLRNWGEKHRGDDFPSGGGGGVWRMMWHEQWNSDQGDRIQLIFSNLGKQGYSGEELIRKVREIFLPSASGASVISLAKEQDDADFVEKCLIETFMPDSPIRAVVIERYRERNYPQNVLRNLTGVDIESCKRRARWAEKLAEDIIFSTMRREMEKEIINKAA